MTDTEQTLLNALPRLKNRRVLVIGDVILDEYLFGSPSRLSREAPIPVLEYNRRQIIPGGAANPAMNISALGSTAFQIGLVGDDLAGQELISRLEKGAINAAGIVTDPRRCTTQKTRILSTGLFPQQLARLDRIDRHLPDPEIEQAIIANIEATAPQVEAILVSDYRSGLLSDQVVQAILRVARQNKLLLSVDSQGNLDKYSGYAIIRANDRDTAAFLKQPLESEGDFEAASLELLTRLKAQGIVIGRGSKGVSLRGLNSPYQHFPPANLTEVFDVTGAGDTSIAVLTLGLIAGLNLAQSALLANIAAGLVVQRLGNVAPTIDELRQAIVAKT